MIGVDIEDINRFVDKTEKFFDRIFSKEEIRYCLSKSKPQEHFAVRFCAKEATIKALSGYGIKNLVISDIEVFHDENNCPQIRTTKQLEQDYEIQLSLSHDKTKAVAFVVATRKETKEVK